MSRSVIACPKCKHPLAVKHHSGRIRVRDGVGVVIVAAAVELTCGCGGKRVIGEAQRVA